MVEPKSYPNAVSLLAVGQGSLWAKPWAFWPLLAGVGALVCLAPGAVATRASSEQAALTKLATQASHAAQKNLQTGNARRAITAAERAVAAMPSSAAYRVQLGQSYMMAGRFFSAETAFADALALEPSNSTAILKLALVRIALGKPKAARDLLESQQSELPVSDYGLALALAGDPAAGIAVLVPAMRAGEANARLRQNLALAFAMAGRWEDARAMALVDLPPDMADARLKQWAAIARPDQPWVQMAKLMDIKVPANWQMADTGQPQELALNRPNQLDTGFAQLDVRPTPPENVPEAVPQAASVVAAQLARELRPAADQSRYEVLAEEKDPAIVPAYVKRLPAPAPTAALQQRWSRALRSGEGYVVQIGAYRTPQAAAKSWAQTAKRWRHLEAYAVHQARVQGEKGTVYRISLGKFASREEARRVCGQLRAQGASCFPRAVTAVDTLRYAAKAPARPRLLAMR